MPLWAQQNETRVISLLHANTNMYVQTDNKTDVSLIGPSNFTKPQPDVTHQVKADGKVVNDKAKVSQGPKHYGALMQKVPPCERVMSALLQWKTPETVKYLAGFLPDHRRINSDDGVSKRYCPNTYKYVPLQIHIPTVDSQNQMSLRRRIVMQQLMKGYGNCFIV